jgi:NADPH2:quinone reductase
VTAVRAVRVHEFGGPDVLVLDEVPQPVPVEGEVLVRIQAAGVNPFETYARAGSYSHLPALPYTPGCDGAGVRVDTGERVYVTDSLSGTYAEYALCPAEAVRPLPDDLSYAQGAAVGVPYFTAYRALLQRAAAKDGERVLVHGASGGVGIATVQLAVAAGLEVTGTAGSEAGSELVAAQGVARVLDHGDPAHVDAALALTGGAGFDIIIEFLANVNLGSDLKLLAKRGRVVVVGSRGAVEVDARDLMNAEGAVLGMLTPNARHDEVAAALGAVDAGLRSGVLKPVIGREVPLAEAARAHRLIMERPALGKMVLVP